MSSIPSADIHTPEELLANAEAMYHSGDPKLFRGAILEAITALEAFVQKTVFPSLQSRLDPILTAWLEERTRMDFDARLSVLVPVATGVSIDKSTELWAGYKKAKEIRNDVVHSGRKVAAIDVAVVIRTVREWLSLLGRTVQLETALLELKRWVEQTRGLSIARESEATHLVARYFERSRAASSSFEEVVDVNGRRRRADLILSFGEHKVLIETTFSGTTANIRNVIDSAVSQVDQLRHSAQIGQACVIVFLNKPLLGIPGGVERHRDGQIYSIAIQVHGKHTSEIDRQ